MYDLTFITEDNFIAHVKETIGKYGDNLTSFDLLRFNRNIIDPIKLVFDKTVYGFSWEELIKNEIFRQRDKANNNDIGYFHQNIFSYITHCTVPESGWDVIFRSAAGVKITHGRTVNTVYVELKNKHNTMNSAAAGKTFMRMQNQLLKDDNCACFLVEAIAKKSQNIEWKPKVDGEILAHNCIRRVSLDRFYEIVTGEEKAFYQICNVLPSIIKKVVEAQSALRIQKDTVFQKLTMTAQECANRGIAEDFSFVFALYLLAFPSYKGFQLIQ